MHLSQLYAYGNHTYALHRCILDFRFVFDAAHDAAIDTNFAIDGKSGHCLYRRVISMWLRVACGLSTPLPRNPAQSDDETGIAAKRSRANWIKLGYTCVDRFPASKAAVSIHRVQFLRSCESNYHNYCEQFNESINESSINLVYISITLKYLRIIW